MSRAVLDPDVRALLDPVREPLERALSALQPGPAVRVRCGAVAGFYRVEDRVVVLSTELTGPGMFHSREPTALAEPVDRWRRAMASVLEGVVWVALADRAGTRPLADTWWASGCAVHAADRAAPELRLATADLAVARSTGDLAAHPRAGVAVMRAWEAAGVDPWDRVLTILRGGEVAIDEWLRAGAWLLGAAGAAAVPAGVARVPDSDFPVHLGPWRWQPLAVPAHARGGMLVCTGDGGVDQPFAPAGTSHRALAGSLGGELTVEGGVGGPVGSWRVASASGFGQTFGARGIVFSFGASGRFELTLADSFIGPAAALELAAQMGTSGVAVGRWEVAGAQQVRFAALRVQGVTTHGRSHETYAMPAGVMGPGGWVKSLDNTTWRWGSDPDGSLWLDGHLMGGQVRVVLRREA